MSRDWRALWNKWSYRLILAFFCVFILVIIPLDCLWRHRDAMRMELRYFFRRAGPSWRAGGPT